MEKTAANFAYAIMVRTAPVHVYAVQEDGTRTLISSFSSAGQRVFLAQTRRTEIVGDYDLFTGPLTTAALIGAGSDGADGLSAYELAVQQGFTGSLGEWLESLRGETGATGAPGKDGEPPSAEDVAAALVPMISAELAYEGPSATNNWHANYFQLGENYLPQGTALSELGYRVRFDSIAGCTTEPVYLGVWELSEDGGEWELRGVSLNTQEQALSSDVMWRFEPAKVRLSGRPIRCCLMEAREDGWRTDLTMGMRVSSATGANTAIFLNEQSWASVPKYFLRGYKPVESISVGGGAEGGGENDTTTQLSAEELNQLKQLLKEYKEGTLGGGNSNCDHAGDGVGSINLGSHSKASSSGCIALGFESLAVSSESICIGANTSTSGFGSIVIGATACTGMSFSLSIGYGSSARGRASAALGYGARAYEDGVFVLATGVENMTSSMLYERITQLYLIAQGSDLAKKYTDGEAALGYIVVDEGGTDNDWTKISASGTRKLSELLTDNKGSFVPAVYSFKQRGTES